jgi:hypothetical protein
MRRVVFLDDLKESDIRPENIYNEYKKLLDNDIKQFFLDKPVMDDIACPGCFSKEMESSFDKNGFTYHICGKCWSWYVSPRPSEKALRDFYRDSYSGKFLRETFFKKTSKTRAQNIFSYRTQWLIDLAGEYLSQKGVFLDYSTRYPDFLKELKETDIFSSFVSLSPQCYEQEDVLSENAKIIKCPEELTEDINIFGAFEIIERVYSPKDLFALAYRVCAKNGLLVISSVTSSGFEYQVLRNISPNVIVPDRLNILSLEALISRIKSAGFEIIEVSTPGRLDIEMVKREYEKDRTIPIDPFWKYVFDNRDKEALRLFQDYLQQFQLSSHVRIAAIKK